MTDGAARKFMVDGQLRPNKVTDARVLAAMGRLPREAFVPAACHARAYADDAVPLCPGRAMMAPMVLARLVQAAEPALGQSALVVGAATGYAAAVLAHMGLVVTALEQDSALQALAQPALAAALPGARPRLALGSLVDGHPAGAPYDVILLDGAVGQLPPALEAQLAEGGRIVGVFDRPGQVATAMLGRKLAGRIFLTPIMDAYAPGLPGFVPAPGFVF
ncbi:MAG: protein-L-isoaspartate O-methyltransferase [Rubritepida sp.]|nr:protein-L-isoaspartate O-methyltransferase [Rubritepida sp.]